MAKKDELPRFRPERPIYLSRENTTFKTADELEHAVEQLRDRKWLVAVNEKIRPLHMSFNDVKEFSAFKKDAKDLGITLKEPTIKADDLEALEAEDQSGAAAGSDANANSSYEDSSGKLHLG